MGAHPDFLAQPLNECHAFSGGAGHATFASLITPDWHHTHRHVATICSHGRKLAVSRGLGIRR